MKTMCTWEEDDFANLSQKSYSILKEEDIRQRQEEDVTKISTLLSISREAASILLRRYNWEVVLVHEHWFADEEIVRKSVGLLDNPNSVSTHRSNKELACGICFICFGNLRSAGCSHLYCDTCWKSYITTSINNDGPGCLMLRCPEPSCGTAVGRDMINGLSSEEDKHKYQRYLIRSYVEDGFNIKWCPAPGCDSAVEYHYVHGSGSYDVICSCSYSFCWNCLEEAHRPVDCETVAKWIQKNSAESENMNWILDNSKPCPKCKRPIEKKQGSMHMTCKPPCKFEFCWLCLGAWSDHGERTRGFYAFNRYKTYDAENPLERYTHYYERWASNETSRQKALTDLHLMQTSLLEKLSEKHGQLLNYIVEAWQQIVECRRVLKWTYPYGYYLPEHEHTRKQFLEYLQEEAEAGLERLHQCAEEEVLRTYKNVASTSENFKKFRTKLACLTRVTRNYFENLVSALEDGLSDVDSQAASSNSDEMSIPG